MKYNVRCHHCGQLFPAEAQPGERTTATCPHCGKDLQFTAPDNAPEPKPANNRRLALLVGILALLTIIVYIGHSFYDSYLDRQNQRQMARLLQLDSARTAEADAVAQAHAIRRAREDSILHHSEQFIKERVDEIYALAFAVVNGAANDTLDISRDFFTSSLQESLSSARRRARVDSTAVAPPNFWTQGYSRGRMLPARVVNVGRITTDSAEVYLHVEQRRSRDDEPLRTSSYGGMLRLALTDGHWLIDDFVNDKRGSFRKLLKPRTRAPQTETEEPAPAVSEAPAGTE